MTTKRVKMRLPDLSIRSGFGGDHLIVSSSIRDLRSRQAAFRAFAEMRDHSAVIGAALFAIESILRKVKWRVEPGDKSATEARRALIVDGMRHDMEISWGDTVSEAIQFIVNGFSFAEVVYKIRRGPEETSPRYRSRHTDGLVGWRRWVFVDPLTVNEWLWSEGDSGALVGLVQSAPPDYSLRTVPLTKALHFKTREAGGNPEGRSLLVNAYLPWVFAKRTMELEAIGVERDLAGIPFAGVPPELLDPNATDEDKAMLEAIKKVVTGVRQNSQAGVIFPLAYDPDGQGHPMYEFKLLTSAGMKQLQPGAIVERYEARAAMALLADFILLGQGSSGSFALSREKSTLIARALEAILGIVADQINSHEIPRLYRLNGWDAKAPCRLVPSSPENADLKNLGVYARNLAVAGLLTPDPKLEASLRDVADLPQIDPEYERGPEDTATDSSEPDDEDKRDGEGGEGGEGAAGPTGNEGKDMGPKPKKRASNASASRRRRKLA